MATLADFRAQNPVYDDMSDADLATALHAKFYSDLPQDEFFAQLGLASSEPYDPLARPAHERTQFGMMGGAGEGPTEPGPAIAPTPPTPIDDLAKRGARGAVDIISRLPEAEAIRQSGRDEAIVSFATDLVDQARATIADIEARLSEAPDMPEDQRARIEDVRRQAEATIENYSPIMAGSDPAENITSAADREVYQFGDHIRRASLELFGTPNPEFDDRFIAKLAEGAGSLTTFVGVTLLTGLTGGAVTGASANAAAMYERALEEGASEEEARLAAYLGSVVGASEVMPIGRAFELLPSKTREHVADIFGDRLANIYATSREEGVQEALVEVINNLTAQGVWNSETGTFDGATDSFLIGAILGGAMGAVATPKATGLPQQGLEAIASFAEPPLTEAQALAERVLKRLKVPTKPEIARRYAPPAPPSNPPADIPPQAAQGDPMSDVSPLTANMLEFIGAKEAPLGYDQIYSGSAIDTPKPLTSMTIREVLAWQDASVAAGSASSAAGRFQFIRKTLRGLVSKLGLTGDEVFSPDMQKRLAVELMREQGLAEFEAGRMSVEEFGNRLATVWAALPQVSGQNAGRGVYDGDGLNSALASAEEFLGVLGGDPSGAAQTPPGGSGFIGGEQKSPQVVADVPAEADGATKGSTSEAVGPATLPEPSTPATTPVASDPAPPPPAESTAQTPVEANTPEAVESAAQDAATDPTDAQKEAGNYKKGHIRLQGLDITIENMRGSERRGVDADGNAWSVEMPAHYGYVKRTEGADGDQIDVYIGDNPDADSVFIVDQVDPGTGKFDEHKAMVGFDSVEAAAEAYDRGFSDGKGADRMSAIRELRVADFKEWLRSGDTTKPYSKQRPAYAPEAPAGDASFQGMVDMLRASNPGITDADAGKLAKQLMRKTGASVPSTGAAEYDFDRLTPQQQIDAIALAQASGMPNEPTKAKKRKASTKPRKKGGPTAKEIELARKTAIDRLKEARLDIERKLRLGDDTATEVTLVTPSGKKTTFRFPATEASVDNVKRIMAAWKSKPQKVLAFDPPTAVGEGLMFFNPMPNHQGMYRNAPAPMFPVTAETFELAGEQVPFPEEHKPVRRETIRVFVEGVIGKRIYQGKVKGKTRAGFYMMANGGIRLNQFDDIEVLAHEMAHWMDFNSTMGGRFNRMRKSVNAKAKQQMRDLSYTDAPGNVELEGFAEFVRLWLTQYDVAKAQAPDFLTAFEAELATEKKFQRQMVKIRREMHRYFFQGPLAQARANIGQDETIQHVTRKFVQSRPIERLRQQAVDRLHGIKVAEREATGTISNDAQTSPFKLMQMVNGAGALYDTVIEDGTPMLTPNGIEKAGKSLNEVFAPIYKLGAKAFDDFLTYAAGRRARELARQGRENLFTPDQINAMTALERPEFVDAFADFQTFNKEMLKFYVDMGLITHDQRIEFEKNNANYMPFHRVAEALETGANRSQAPAIGARLQGGDRNVRDLADNIVMGLMTNIRQAMIARAKRQLYAALSRSDQGGQFAAPLPRDSKIVQAHLQDLSQKVAETMARLGFGVSNGGLVWSQGDSGTMTDVSEIQTVLDNNPHLLQMWQHNLPPTTKETFVDSAIINGRVEYFEVIDPVLIDSLLGQDMADLGMLYEAGASVKNLMTRLITSMPPFMVPNIVRDTLTAGTMSDSGFVPFVDSIRGAGHIFTQSKTYRDWQRNGGGYSSLVQATTQKKGQGRATLNVPGDWQHPLAVLSKTLAAWDSVASLFENATRVGEFIKAQKKGVSKTEAAFRSREISTDFAKRPGNIGWGALLRLTAFMNAALQGNDRMLKAFIGEDGRVDRKRLAKVGTTTVARLFTRVGVGMASFTALLWYLQHDDERYQELTPDQKSRFWHIFFPWQTGSIQIPKPYGMGFIFGDVVENALDYVAEHDGDAVARNLAWSAAHHFWFLDYPSILQPFMDDLKNETFTGAPVVPVYMQDLSPPNQFRSTTPEVYQQIGDRFGLSPMRTQHYARGFLGYLETAFADLTEAMLWDEAAYGARPFPRGVDDYFLKQFKGSPFPYRTKYTERYYELRQRARTAAQDLRALERNSARKPARLAKFAGDKLATTLAELDGRFRKVDTGLRDMRSAIEVIKYDRRKSREVKEREIEQLYRAKNEIMRKVYTAIETTVAEIEKEIQ